MSGKNVLESQREGNGYARITPLNHTHTQDCYGVITDSTSLKELICNTPVGGDGQVRNYSTSGSSSVTLPAGHYRLEVWGASGGNYSTSIYGGKGGYSTGEIALNSSTTVYIYVGGKGLNNTGNNT